MFDRVEIKVRAGDGGNGSIGFRREKFVPFGGPDGGDGGDGGSVVIKADESVDSLRRFRQKRNYQAEGGVKGGGSKKKGRNGADLVIAVPLGTVVSEKVEDSPDSFLADLVRAGDEVVVVKGGSGGWGNARFATSVNQAPRIAQRGEVGEERSLLLEMRLIADIGIIGYPNVGKSTLLRSASAARPKVDSYPFTTIEPVLGVVEVGQESFVMAEIPGLIEDAHLGKGLGHDFLRHIMRTKMLIHLLSGSSPDPLDDMMRVNEELSLFDSYLARKLQVVSLNKIDLPEVQAALSGIKEAFSRAGVKVFCISAATGQGVPELMAAAEGALKDVASEGKFSDEPIKVFRPKPSDTVVGVRKEGDKFVISVPGWERLIFEGGLGAAELRGQLKSQLARLGAGRVLEKAGVKPGDRIRCGTMEWEW